MKYRDLYFKIINDNKDNPDFEDSALKLLFLHAANTSDFISLLDLELDNKTYNKLSKDIDHYLNGELVQHIIGYSYFYGLKLYVNKNVLTPRQETEILVEKLLEEIQNEFNTNIKLLDIGTGSGAIGLVVKKIKDNIDVTLLDI